MNAAIQPWRILLVDDHPLVLSGVRAALRRVLPKAHVEAAGSASEALKKFTTLQPQLVLLDVNLPGTSGLDLARQIRAANGEVKMLMVAAETDPWTVREAFTAGASGFIAKTAPAGSLERAVLAVLSGRTFPCEESQAALERTGQRPEWDTPPPGPAILSPREREILRYLAHGENVKTIAGLLQISPKTVETHRQHIMRKLGTSNVAALACYAIRHGLMTV